MYEAVRGCCEICGTPHEVLCIDHDHKTEAIRGLLCVSCNLALGSFKDSLVNLEAAIIYLTGQKECS